MTVSKDDSDKAKYWSRRAAEVRTFRDALAAGNARVYVVLTEIASGYDRLAAVDVVARAERC